MIDIQTSIDIRGKLAHIKMQVDQLSMQVDQLSQEIKVIRETTLLRMERQIINQLSAMILGVVLLNILMLDYMYHQYGSPHVPTTALIIIGVATFLYVIGRLVVKLFRAFGGLSKW